MPRYHITTEVSYFYEVEADSKDEAEKQGWMYEDYKYNAEVQHILVNELEDDEEDEEEEYDFGVPDVGDATDAGIAGE